MLASLTLLRLSFNISFRSLAGRSCLDLAANFRLLFLSLHHCGCPALIVHRSSRSEVVFNALLLLHGLLLRALLFFISCALISCSLGLGLLSSPFLVFLTLGLSWRFLFFLLLRIGVLLAAPLLRLSILTHSFARLTLLLLCGIHGAQPVFIVHGSGRFEMLLDASFFLQALLFAISFSILRTSIFCLLLRFDILSLIFFLLSRALLFATATRFTALIFLLLLVFTCLCLRLLFCGLT